MPPKSNPGDQSSFGFTFTSTRHDDTYPFINPLKSNASDLRVLVTGASKGIGRATVISFARSGVSGIAMLARSNLDAVAREVLEAARAAGRKEPKLLKLQADMTDQIAVEKAMATVEQEFGSLDVVINNASYLEKWIPIAESDVNDWWRTWEVNIKGTYLVCRASVPLLLKGKQKMMVMVTSAGAFNTRPGGSAYQTTKTAQIRLSYFLMAEYGEQGLLAYAIHPGGVKTELAMNMPEDMYEILTCTPELAADTMVWLTRERREWIAGRYINAPWDMEEFLAKKDAIVQNDLLKIKLHV
ncbi:uncharacterized protein Z518_10337 [Rhinocladiella mackenziei CBS 650.93]|uniref:Uncharacterized protein n=1 Tax=Rhinocladiella mackenziei CBS 650.93 TaxID=1442369 RepID=A0A0D2I338_9EURO|nr:uncharacterized protein Z518_10337 [Rhinocladiella mackenziei CBS 650.93]KIX00199.1 hypothetical protein Z518_10337 [Rhinocladiella mackenziei CBS 650.93]